MGKDPCVAPDVADRRPVEQYLPPLDAEPTKDRPRDLEPVWSIGIGAVRIPAYPGRARTSHERARLRLLDGRALAAMREEYPRSAVERRFTHIHSRARRPLGRESSTGAALTWMSTFNKTRSAATLLPRTRARVVGTSSRGGSVGCNSPTGGRTPVRTIGRRMPTTETIRTSDRLPAVRRTGR